MTPQAALRRGLAELGLATAAEAEQKLQAYLALLGKWNRTYNLTAIRDPHEMVAKHLLDSLAMQPFVRDLASLADLGTGPGLPGIPLAIANPALAVTLLDSNGKKARFLRQAVMELRLANVQVHQGRAETWRPPAPFAVVIARGFAELADFLAACRHLAAPDGVLAAMKGRYPHEELARLPAGLVRCEVRPLRVPLLEGERHLVLCRPVG